MDVLAQLEKDFIQSLKEKNELVVLVLRQLKTAITNAEIIKKREKLSSAEVIKLLRSEVKKRKDAAELYEKGGRPELAEKEKKEIAIIIPYLPAELSEEKIKQTISAVIKKLGAAGLGDTGKVMGAAMKELAGAVDGNLVGRLVKEQLNPPAEEAGQEKK